MAVRFIDREWGECAWPLWGDDNLPIEEKMCCGAPVPPGAFYQFCKDHQETGFQATQPRGVKAA